VASSCCPVEHITNLIPVDALKAGDRRPQHGGMPEQTDTQSALPRLRSGFCSHCAARDTSSTPICSFVPGTKRLTQARRC
jgi:hypothetical protein